MNYEELVALAEEIGFNAWAPLDVSTIELKQEVRDMCAVNTCGKYGTSWGGPPGCGTLEECGARLHQFSRGILVQTIGEIEDAMDFEGMMDAAANHGTNFTRMHDALREKGCKVLAIGAGCCAICEKCTYPDAPCRFPDRQVASMEAYGMLVMEVCKANGLKYYYGADKIAYTGCYLVE